MKVTKAELQAEASRVFGEGRHGQVLESDDGMSSRCTICFPALDGKSGTGEVTGKGRSRNAARRNLYLILNALGSRRIKSRAVSSSGPDALGHALSALHERA
jgi:hypothetical protein